MNKRKFLYKLENKKIELSKIIHHFYIRLKPSHMVEITRVKICQVWIMIRVNY